MDNYADLSQRTRVPTFWAGRPAGPDIFYASMLTLPVSVIICVLQFTVSDYVYGFDLPFETKLWYGSSFAIAFVGIAIMVLAILAPLIGSLFSDSDKISMLITGISYIPLCIIYVGGRLSFVVLSFAEFTSLPFSAYLTVQWTMSILHL